MMLIIDYLGTEEKNQILISHHIQKSISDRLNMKGKMKNLSFKRLHGKTPLFT